MVLFIDSLVHSFKKIRQNWKLIPLAAAFDFAFFFLLGFFGISSLRNSVAQPVANIIELAGKLTLELTQAAQEGTSTFKTLMSDPMVAANVDVIVSAVILFISLTYAFWISFNGTSWFLSHKMLGEKHPQKYVSFFAKFSFISFVWTAVVSLVSWISLRFIFFALLRPDQVTSSSVIETVLNITHFTLLYFVLISLALVPHTSIPDNFKKTFKYGVKKVHQFIPAFAIIAAILYANFMISFYALQPAIQGATDTTAAGIVVIIVRFLFAAPFLVFARMYLMDISKRATHS